jgi:regulatory protein
MKTPPALPVPPDRDSLRAYALTHLARFDASEAGLVRVLRRRIERWVRGAERAGLTREAIAESVLVAREAIPLIVVALRSAGLVNDSDFAANRARRLFGSGKSRGAVLANLEAHGIDAGLAREVVPEHADRNLAAACVVLRRRQFPPFGTGDRQRALALLARAGFSRRIAESAMAMDTEAAEALIASFRNNL